MEHHASSRVDMNVRSGASAMTTAFPNGAPLVDARYEPQVQVRPIIAPTWICGPIHLADV